MKKALSVTLETEVFCQFEQNRLLQEFSLVENLYHTRVFLMVMEILHCNKEESADDSKFC